MGRYYEAKKKRRTARWMTDERMEVEWILFDPKRNDKEINGEYPLISIKRGPFQTIKFNDFRKSHLIYSYLCWSCRVVYDCVRLLALYRISHIWIGLNWPTPFQKIIIRALSYSNWRENKLATISFTFWIFTYFGTVLDFMCCRC